MVLHKIISWQNFADVAWFMLLFWLFIHFYRERRNLLKARLWFLTKGEITEFLWTSDGAHLWPKIQYTYQAYDKEFQGEYFFLDTSHNNPNSNYSRLIAYRVAVAFEKGETVDVFYNPADPRQAVLDIRIPTKLNVMLGLLAGLITVQLIVMLYRFL